MILWRRGAQLVRRIRRVQAGTLPTVPKNGIRVIMAGKNTSVSLSDHYLAFAEAKVREGRYASTSEVIRAGLRLLEAEEQRLGALRVAIQEGLDSGPSRPFDMRAWIDGRFPAE